MSSGARFGYLGSTVVESIAQVQLVHDAHHQRAQRGNFALTDVRKTTTRLLTSLFTEHVDAWELPHHIQGCNVGGLGKEHLGEKSEGMGALAASDLLRTEFKNLLVM